MMTLCSHCGKTFAMEDDVFGKNIFCIRCGKPFRANFCTEGANRTARPQKKLKPKPTPKQEKSEQKAAAAEHLSDLRLQERLNDPEGFARKQEECLGAIYGIYRDGSNA